MIYIMATILWMFTFSGLSVGIIMATLAILPFLAVKTSLEWSVVVTMYTCMVEYWNSGLNVDPQWKWLIKRWIEQKVMTKTKKLFASRELKFFLVTPYIFSQLWKNCQGSTKKKIYLWYTLLSSVLLPEG